MRELLKRIAGYAARRVAILILLVAALAAGYALRSAAGGGGSSTDPSASSNAPVARPEGEHAEQADQEHAEGEHQIWTCPMHPQIRLPEPGNCPLCGMELVPVSEGAGADAEEAILRMSPAAVKLAEIQTSEVRRRFPSRQVRMVGKVQLDEQRVRDITAWVGGRLDRLFVDFTGARVQKGHHLVEIYSPALISAQEELIQALATAERIRTSSMSSIKRTSAETVEAAREKLRLWGLKPEQIEAVEQSGEPVTHLTIPAPQGGIVVHKHKNEGQYVKTGSKIYTIADLSQVWIMLDAYESDLRWLRYGQPVRFGVEAYPGEEFTGRVAFIEPILTEKTRTVRVRVNAPNPQGRLRPGMFVRATVDAQLGPGGRVVDPALEGKWICPMHPSVFTDEPGLCDICGMELVTTRSLGYAPPDAEKEGSLAIPASAPLITGKRAVVYVKVPDAEVPTFEGREVVLGPRAGDFYVVEAGLEEGERVVTHGSFKIDSALQIQARPSMMSKKAEPTEEIRPPEASETPAAFREQLWETLGRYVQLQRTLADGAAPGWARQAAAQLQEQLGNVDMTLLQGEAHMAWMEQVQELQEPTARIAAAREVSEQKQPFAELSEAMAEVLRRFGLPEGRSAYLFWCPMAFDGKGASWLQKEAQTHNPYFGPAMPGCGEIMEEFGAERQPAQDPGEGA